MAKYLDSDILKINWMKLHNFMGIDGELYIDFKDTEEFIGDNGAGKSTILDAIAFVFCYTDAFGNANNKVSFSHAREIATETYVEIEARIDNVTTVLKRNFSVSATGRQSSSLYVDHNEIKITEWKKRYDKDVFLSLINPKYFSSLSTSAVKDLLVKFIEMKGIDLTTILAGLDNDAMEFLMEELEEQEIDVVKQHYEDCLKEGKDAIKEKKNEIKKLKMVPKVEHPEDEYHIKGLIFTEGAAFETLMDDFESDSSADNKNWIKIFMEQKAKRAASLEQFKLYNEALADIDTKENEILEIEKGNADIETKLGYIRDFYNIVLSNIDITKRVPNMRFVFTDALGKEEFVILYEDVPVKECSFAEQVKAGILLSDFLQEYVDINYPIFIDNAECITQMPKLLNEYHQMMSFTVMKGFALSRYVGDVVENLETLETMPRSHVKGMVKTRLLGTTFEDAE